MFYFQLCNFPFKSIHNGVPLAPRRPAHCKGTINNFCQLTKGGKVNPDSEYYRVCISNHFSKIANISKQIKLFKSKLELGKRETEGKTLTFLFNDIELLSLKMWSLGFMDIGLSH